ncbi:MAG: LysR family transcriptional regulator [Polyangiaceae bacterium]
MNWDDLRVFLAIQRQGTVSAAAGALGVSRSTIHRRLAALEEAAGMKLIEPTAQGFVPTEAGERLVPVAESVEAEALRATQLFDGHALRLSGRLDVTLFEVAGPLLAPIFAELAAAHPEIRIRLLSTDRTVSLRRRESDIAIRATDQPSPELFGRKLGQMPFGVYGRQDVVAQADAPWVMWDEGVGAERTWELARRESGGSPRVAARVDSVHVMLDLVDAGAGVALLPVALAAKRPALRPRGAIPRAGMSMDVWVLTHRDLRQSARVRLVMNVLGQRAPALLNGDDRQDGGR